jgi:hypothetical protein
MKYKVCELVKRLQFLIVSGCKVPMDPFTLSNPTKINQKCDNKKELLQSKSFYNIN